MKTTRWPRYSLTKQTDFCHRDAAQAAEELRALRSAYHDLAVAVEERPHYGPGRPSATKPRAVKALHYGLQVRLEEKPEVRAQKVHEAGCFVLVSNVPSDGEMAHSPQQVLGAYKEQHGIEQNYGFLLIPSDFVVGETPVQAIG